MNVIHNGVNIEYIETDNTWEFTLRGRERAAPSLRDAKATIDTPVKEKPDKAFTPVKGWVIDWSGARVDEAVATSIARESFGTKRVRVTIKGRSSIENQRDFFPLNEKNANLVNELRRLQSEIEDRQDKRRDARDKLKGFEE